MFAVCYNCGTRHTGMFAVCVSFAVCHKARHTANMGFAVCWILCRMLPFRHTAKATFAVCPIFDIRQSLRHTTTSGFPIVRRASWCRERCAELRLGEEQAPRSVSPILLDSPSASPSSTLAQSAGDADQEGPSFAVAANSATSERPPAPKRPAILSPWWRQRPIAPPR